MLGSLVILEPFDSLAHLPNAVPFLALLYIDALSVLLALVPLALVAATIGPCESTDSVFLIVTVLAYVLASIAPGEDAASFHPVVNPIALVHPAVRPDVFAHTVDIVLIEVSVVRALVTPDKLAFSVLHAFDIFSRVLGTVRPLLNTLSMLFVS